MSDLQQPQHSRAIGMPPSPTAGPSSAPGRAWRYVGGGRGFVWLSLAVATLFVLPVLAVVVNIFAPSGGAWSHLAGTVLPHYIANTLWLVLGVGLGVPVIGAGTAWLVTMCRFPGRRVF